MTFDNIDLTQEDFADLFMLLAVAVNQAAWSIDSLPLGANPRAAFLKALHSELHELAHRRGLRAEVLPWVDLLYRIVEQSQDLRDS